MKISYKAVLQGTTHLNTPINNASTCVLPISVGWYYHEADYLRATLNIASEKFAACRIVICDTLQRYSLAFLHPTLSHEYSNFTEYARALGNDWLKRNAELINTIPIPCCINRWDDFIQNDVYQKTMLELEKKVFSDATLSAYFYDAAENTYHHFKLHDRFSETHVNKTDFIEASIKYLIEESAVTITWREYQETILLYPKSITKAVISMLDIFLGDKRHFLQPLQISFKPKRVLS